MIAQTRRANGLACSITSVNSILLIVPQQVTLSCSFKVNCNSDTMCHDSVNALMLCYCQFLYYVNFYVANFGTVYSVISCVPKLPEQMSIGLHNVAKNISAVYFNYHLLIYWALPAV